MTAEKQRSMTSSKQTNRRRTNSRGSIVSISNLSRQQQHPLTANPQMRSNRSLSRVSFISANNIDTLRVLKPIHQGSLESLTESVKSGIHVEFKLSTQSDENKQSPRQALNEQKGFFFFKKKMFLWRNFLGIIFDVPKPVTDVHQDIIALTQAKCKRLLAEMRQKMFVILSEIFFYPNFRFLD